MLAEDPSLRLRHDAESGQTMLGGMGELQLDVTLEKMRQNHGVAFRTGAPLVAWRETIAGQSELRYLHKKQSGGPGQYAEVVLALSPLPRGAGVRFENRVTGGAIPREFIPAIEAAVHKAAAQGVLAGYPLVDLEVVLLDGSFHERDSSQLAFETATLLAMRQAVLAAQALLLEPLMALEIHAPAQQLGAVIGDLGRRRAEIRAQLVQGEQAQLEALAPLQEMFGYISHLRALTSGRGHFTMQFAHYEKAPAAVVQALLQKA